MSNQAATDKSIQVDFTKHLTLTNEGIYQSKNCNFQEIITRDEAEYISRLVISTDIELLDYNVQPYTEEKIGFLGSHKKLILNVRDPESNVNVKISFFVKTIPYDVPVQAEYILQKNVFAKEVEFFRNIEPLMRKNYKGEPWTPKCYLAKKDSLVWEDMKIKGFVNRPKILNEESIMSAVACIARFHASSLLAEERLGGKAFNEVYPNALEESEYKTTGRKFVWFTTAINYVISVAKDLGLETNHIFEASKRVFETALSSKVKRNVFIHGDLWSSNILFDENNNCRLVDFQLMRYAPPGQDLMHLLYLCTLREFREEKEASVLEHYYMHFKKTLEINNFTGMIPTFEEIKQGALEQKFPAMVNAAINLPTMMMDGKIGAKIMNSSNSYDDYFFRDRKPIVDQIMALDAEYEKKIKDFIREFVEACAKVEDFPRVV